MDAKDRHAKHVSLAVQGLVEVAEEFESQVGRKPAVDELFQVITQALKSGSAENPFVIDLASIKALNPQIPKQPEPPDSKDKSRKIQSVVKGLNDAPFVIASDLIADINRGIREEKNRVPTLEDLTAVLLDALHNSADNLLADVRPALITGITAETTKRRKIIPQLGDLVAIPARNSAYFIAIVLAKNKYGVAYGMVDGTTTLDSFDAKAKLSPRGYPIYSSDELVASGRWKIIGHSDDLRSLFPADPEIFFRKQVIPGAEKLTDNIGPYGSGKTASGSKRNLTKEEAEELGLLSGEYRQFYLPEILEKHLNSQLK